MPIGQMRQTIFKDDPTLSLFQQAIQEQFSQVGVIPFMNGNKLDDIDLTTGTTNIVNHKLARKAVGYFVILNSANSVIWNDDISGDTTITLRCSANTTVSLWVF